MISFCIFRFIQIQLIQPHNVSYLHLKFEYLALYITIYHLYSLSSMNTDYFSAVTFTSVFYNSKIDFDVFAKYIEVFIAIALASYRNNRYW